MSCLLAKLAIMYYIQHSRYNNSRMFLLLTNSGSACSFLKYWRPIVEKVKFKGLQVINVKYTWAFRPIKVEAQSVQTAKNWNFGCLVVPPHPDLSSNFKVETTRLSSLPALVLVPESIFIEANQIVRKCKKKALLIVCICSWVCSKKMEVDDEWEFSAEELDFLEREALQQIAQRHSKPFSDSPSYKVRLSPFSSILSKDPASILPFVFF